MGAASIGAVIISAAMVVFMNLRRSTLTSGALLGSAKALGGRLDFLQDCSGFLIGLFGAQASGVASLLLSARLLIAGLDLGFGLDIRAVLSHGAGPADAQVSSVVGQRRAARKRGAESRGGSTRRGAQGIRVAGGVESRAQGRAGAKPADAREAASAGSARAAEEEKGLALDS